jgi:GNAT superfamily N-acetyltransferase
MTTSIRKISFEEIETVWYQEDMWGKSAFVSPVSSMLYLDGFNPKIKDLSYSKPVFYAAMINDQLAGVNSYHRVNESQCRSRGLYVFPQFRKLNIGTKLLKYAIDQNKQYDFIWSMPRTTAVDTYKRAGFKITTEMPFGLYANNYYCRYDYENNDNGT